MFRAHRALSGVDRGWRLLAPLLAVALVFSAGVVAPEPAEAGGTSTIAIYRQRQLSAEQDMRRADKQIARLLKQRGSHTKLLRKAKKKLDRAIARRKAAERRADKASSRLRDLELALARETRVRPNPAGTQKVDKPKLRKRIREQQMRVKQLEAKARRAERKEGRVRKLKQTRSRKPSEARLEARRNERERSEERLSATIYNMTALSMDRAGRFGSASVKRFTRPVKGRLSQGWGCTGSRTNPPRGSCRHFHDGIDIAAPKGTRVRASADGYVAYAGWSPWDEGARAYVVIVAHAGGYETVYAHLQPVRRVRAGQKVKRGDVVGTVGVTGLTTGPHVHWEIRKGGTYLNPLHAGG